MSFSCACRNINTLQTEFAKVGHQCEESDPTVIAKFFNPCGGETMYAIYYKPERNICFGYVTGLFEDEYGSFSIDELEALELPPFSLTIEHNLYFTPPLISEIIKKPS